MAPAAAATGTKNMIGSTLTTTDTAAASAVNAVTCNSIYNNTGSTFYSQGIVSESCNDLTWDTCGANGIDH
jgi:hypothetical protein